MPSHNQEPTATPTRIPFNRPVSASASLTVPPLWCPALGHLPTTTRRAIQSLAPCAPCTVAAIPWRHQFKQILRLPWSLTSLSTSAFSSKHLPSSCFFWILASFVFSLDQSCSCLRERGLSHMTGVRWLHQMKYCMSIVWRKSSYGCLSKQRYNLLEDPVFLLLNVWVYSCKLILFLCLLSLPQSSPLWNIIPNPMGSGTGTDLYMWVRVWNSTHNLYVGGWVFSLRTPNLTCCHPN
jgi:hypothetical protein